MGSSTTTAYLRQFSCVLPSSACCVKKKRLFKIPNLRSNVQTFPSGFNPGAGGGDSTYERGGDARRKF